MEPNTIVRGRVAQVAGDEVWIEVNLGCRGVVPLAEWYDEAEGRVVPPVPGQFVEVLIEAAEEESGRVALSRRKTIRHGCPCCDEEERRVLQRLREGDVVSGIITRRVAGGLLVNFGFHAFLPDGEAGSLPAENAGDAIGRAIECKLLKIDEARRTIVVSRRQALEVQRAERKRKLLAEIEPGQIRKGVVKNIAQFGAFVDLGGLDGLLHVTDMAWGRVAHPSEVVQIDQEIEVVVLTVDKEKAKVALGLKQKTPSPWANVEQKYPVGSRHTGEVVNVMSYGAFVKLEPGVEGVVPISEMSWTKRIDHPSELVAIGDTIEVQVLKISKEHREISLGMRQVQPNPWDRVAERYPPGTVITGMVRNLTNYGAFIEIEEGIDGLLHVSDMSWVRKVAHPSEVVARGDKLTCVVLKVDQGRKRIALGLEQTPRAPGG
jgi:small subunit ribosomal protein S1